jgi:RNA polymerase sigma-70 factor (ECF subfamily)
LQTQDLDHITDEELLEKFYSDHENKWLGILLPRYTMLLLGVCMKYLQNEEDAKDGVQQVFLRVIKELHKYRVDYFKSWIYMIAKNHCLMKLRDKNRQPLELNEEITKEPGETLDIKTLMNKEVLVEELGRCLKELNTEQQQCVSLFYLQKKSYHEVSEVTGYSLLQVKSYIQNGKRNLKMMLKHTKDQFK